jgi:biotin transport system substrate-specific component
MIPSFLIMDNDIKSVPDIKTLIAVPMFTAMTAVGAYIAIPIPWSPVPIVLQNFFILLAGLVLGPSMGAAAAGIYLLLGALGLPVFAGGTGGLAHFAGPTGGYLLAYLPSAWIAGVVSRAGISRASKDRSSIKRFIFRDGLAAAAGVLLIYAAGVPWLKYRLGLSWDKAFAAGLVPFIAGDFLKAAAATALAPILRRILRDEGIGNIK